MILNILIVVAMAATLDQYPHSPKHAMFQAPGCCQNPGNGYLPKDYRTLAYVVLIRLNRAPNVAPGQESSARRGVIA